MSALIKGTKAVAGFLKKAIIGGEKKRPEEDAAEVPDDQIGGAATEEELAAQRRKRERARQSAGQSGPIGQREFGTILSGGRKFGG